jgi:hypothetical protein
MSSRFIYQNLEVQSNTEKIPKFALPMSSMHSVISFMEYFFNIGVLILLPDILNNS